MKIDQKQVEERMMELEARMLRSKVRERWLLRASIAWAIVVVLWLCIRPVLAEDCSIWPPENINTTIAWSIEHRPYDRKQRIKRQLSKVISRSNTNLIYFYDNRAKEVTATYGTLGWDQTYAVGPKGYEHIALKIAQGWESQDFGTWWEKFLHEEHRRFVHEIKCEQRNWCRERFNGVKLSLCFQDLHRWPRDRTLYVGNGTIVSFGEMATVKVK